MTNRKKPALGQILTVVFPGGETEEHYVDKVQGQYIFCCGERFHWLDDATSANAWEMNNLGFIAMPTNLLEFQ